MADVPFSALYDNILPYLPGVETGVVDLQIRKALREFFKRTTLWRETFAFATVADQPLYQLLPATGTVHSIIGVTVNDTPIGVVTEEARPAPAQILAQEAATPTGWYSTYPSLISLLPKPSVGHAITVEAVITLPLDSAVVTFPEEAFNQYGEELASGALAILMTMPNKPWTNEKASGIHAGKFVRTCISVRARLRDGGRPNATTARGPRFGK